MGPNRPRVRSPEQLVAVPIDNHELARSLKRIATLLQMGDENPFAIRAYQRAADAVERLGVPVSRLAAEGSLRQLAGIGSKIAQQLVELANTGSCSELRRLRQDIPEGVENLTRVPGVGPKAALALWQHLRITSLEELRAAAQQGRLSAMPRMTAKTEENILRGLKTLESRSGRTLLAMAAEAADAVVEAMLRSGTCQRAVAAGSVRRSEPTVKDVDIVAASDRPERAMEVFTRLPQVVSVLAQGDTKSSVLLPAALQVDLRIVPAESYGNLLQHFTGSKQHNVLMREDAVRRGWSVSEWGLTNVESGRVHRFSNEDDVYRTLGYDPIPPELRQGADELTRAAAHELPTLLRHEDIQGDLHVHTEWSDGKLSVRAMVEAARARGYHYIAICDHSAGRRVGLSPERLPEQWEEIAKVQAALPELHILRGMEVDIKADATLDLPDEWLARLDFVIASIHSAMNQEEGQIMARLLGACRHPAVRAIGHPSGRLLERRQAYPVDYPALFLEAARTGTWLEVNSGPDRLDLDGARAREARAAGCTFMVSSDAHRLEELAWMRWGVATARRGWLEVQEVANAWPWERLQAALAARKEPGGRI